MQGGVFWHIPSQVPGRFLYSTCTTATMNFSRMEDVYLILLLASIPASEAIIPFVNVTTEGGISLVGSHCPGTLRLFCEGTDLTSLRWTFNGDTEIDIFFPNDMEIARPPLHQHRPFTFVALIEVIQNSNNPVYGNFSSVLTVDLSQLEQNVTNISCGDPRTSDTKRVDVTTILQSVPADPNITDVNATYSSAGLESITVAWNKVPTDCPEYGLSLTYIADLTGSDPVKVNETSCGASFCLATFDRLSSDNVEYELTLSVMNDVGSSDLVQYPTVIGSQSGQYITPVLYSSNCITSGQCISSGTLQNGTICSVQYTTDAQYRGLSEAITVPLNTAFQLPSLDSDTTFYFIFTVPVTSTFLVNEQVEFTAGSSCTSPILDTGSIVGMTIVITLIVSVLIGLAIGMLLMYFIMLAKINKINERQASPPQQQTPPPPQQQAGPVYEEVSQPKEEIELKTNQAYGPVRR